MQKESIIFYKSFYEAIKKIPEEYQLELYNAVLSYCFEGTEPENLSGIAEAMFILMKPNIDSAEKRYNASVENGRKGGAPKGNSNAKKQPKTTQKQPQNNLETTQVKPKNNLNVDEDVDKDVDDNVDVDVDVDVDIEISNSKVIDVYENNIAPITPITAQLIDEYCESLSPPLVIEAINKATKANARTFNYIEKILLSWEKKGFKKLIDVKNEEEKFKQNVNINTVEETAEESVKRKIKELEERVSANK